MTGPIVLGTGPLGLVTNPRGGPDAIACKAWLQTLLDAGRRIVIPGIADYEVRRELIRANKQSGLQRLDEFRDNLQFVPIAQDHLFRAAQLWAHVRLAGLPTADRHSLDADCILAAQVLLLDNPDAVIATTNVGHLSRFTSASLRHDIS